MHADTHMSGWSMVFLFVTSNTTVCVSNKQCCITLSCKSVCLKSQLPLPRAECKALGVLAVIRGAIPESIGGSSEGVIETAHLIASCAKSYQAHHPNSVLGAMSVTYIGLQTFAVPGPIILSVVAGAIYPFFEAQVS